ncbi:MAG: hypothetical protein AAFQ94_26695 [Bacteroidota bacterium]
MTEEDLLLIEKYFEGALTGEQAELFERKRESSVEFSNEVKFQKELLAHTEAHIRKELKDQMLSDFRSIDQPGRVKLIQPIRWKYYLSAAAVLILIAVFSIFKFSENESLAIYESYYRPYDGLVVTRSNELNDNAGLLGYQRGEYSTALEYLLATPEIKGVSQGERKLLIANCYLNIDQPYKSLEILESIDSDEKPIIKANISWYRAMSYLKMKQLSEAKAIFEMLAAGNSAYVNKASDILKEAVFN